MTKRCLDEGLIQSYLDGELSPDESARIESHALACAPCAAMVREAEEELALFASAFEADAALAVPTERLRDRIEMAVSDLQAARRREAVETSGEGWGVRRWFASLAGVFALTPARAAAFGGVAAVLTFAVIFSVVRSDVQKTQNQMARVNVPTPDVQPQTTHQTQGADVNAPTRETSDPTTAGSTTTNTTASVTPPAVSHRRAGVVNARDNNKRAPRRVNEREVKPAGEPMLPGEQKYLQSIASLEKTVQGVSDRVLQPSVRAEFERNVAVVDHAISASRRNALRNPKDAEAAKFLFSAYQSKVELLSAVVEQAQVAALGR